MTEDVAGMAQELLDADLRNIEAKVARKEPLSTAQRKLLDEQRKKVTKAAPAEEAEKPWVVWGIGERTYFRWKDKGAPFSTPREMLEWGEKAGVQKRFLRGFLEMGAKGVESGGTAPPAEVGEWAIDLDSVAGTGIAESLDFCRQRVTFLRENYKAAAKRGDQKGVDLWGAKVENALGQLRQLEKEAPKILIDSGKAWDAGEVERVLREVVGSIAKGFRLMISRVDAKLRAETDAGERERIWKREVDGLFRVMGESKFTEFLMEEAE